MLFSPTLDRFPEAGLGVPGVSGKRLVPVVAPRGLCDPNDDLRAPFAPPPTAFWNKGLPAGENGDPVTSLPPGAGLPFPESGELA